MAEIKGRVVAVWCLAELLGYIVGVKDLST